MVKICELCSKEFTVKTKPYPSQQKIENARRFCSSGCGLQWGLKNSWIERREERVAAIQRTMSSPELRKRIADTQAGAKNTKWLADGATYNSKHRWIQKHFERTGICQHCKSRPAKRKNGSSGTEWANLTGNYDRDDRNDWMELCQSCHRFYDSSFRRGAQSVYRSILDGKVVT